MDNIETHCSIYSILYRFLVLLLILYYYYYYYYYNICKIAENRSKVLIRNLKEKNMI